MFRYQLPHTSTNPQLYDIPLRHQQYQNFGRNTDREHRNEQGEDEEASVERVQEERVEIPSDAEFREWSDKHYDARMEDGDEDMQEEEQAELHREDGGLERRIP